MGLIIPSIQDMRVPLNLMLVVRWPRFPEALACHTRTTPLRISATTPRLSHPPVQDFLSEVPAVVPRRALLESTTAVPVLLMLPASSALRCVGGDAYGYQLHMQCRAHGPRWRPVYPALHAQLMIPVLAMGESESFGGTGCRKSPCLACPCTCQVSRVRMAQGQASCRRRRCLPACHWSLPRSNDRQDTLRLWLTMIPQHSSCRRRRWCKVTCRRCLPRRPTSRVTLRLCPLQPSLPSYTQYPTRSCPASPPYRSQRSLFEPLRLHLRCAAVAPALCCCSCRAGDLECSSGPAVPGDTAQAFGAWGNQS